MKIKEILAGVKLTENYDSYQTSLIAEIENNEFPEKVGEYLMKKSLLIANKKILETSSEKVFEIIEVGVTWISKDSNNKLSVQYSKKEKWQYIKDLEKQGFKQKIGKEIFIFKQLLEKERKNKKMPIYQIYKESKNE